MAPQHIRIIQTGDWHLFANTKSWPKAGYSYRQSRIKKCIQRIFEEAQKADFLLLAGDLIDRRQLNDAENNLGWLRESINSIGQEKLLVNFGSHEDESVREWCSAHTAPRTQIGPNLYTIAYSSHDIIFYAVDSALEESREQGLKIKEAIKLILEDRQGTNSNYGQAVIIAQLNKGSRTALNPLKDYINFAALGDHHYCNLMPGKKPYSAYAGTPVARDACGNGECGKRYFIRTTLTANGQVEVEPILLPEGGHQVKVKGKQDTVTIIDGPGNENNHTLMIEDLKDLPSQIIKKINQKY